MKMRTPFRAILAALIVAALGVAWLQFRARDAAQLAHATLEHELAQLHSATKRALARIEQADAAAVQHRAAIEELEKAARAPSAKLAAKPVMVKPRRPWIPERLRTEPEFQLLWLAKTKAELSATYRPLFAKLQFTPPQIDVFERVVMNRAEQFMDLQATQEAQKLRPDDPALARMRARILDDFRDAQRQLLGEAGFAALQDYERGTSVREIVAGFAGGAVLVAREPLTPQQAEQLFQTIANASPRYRQGNTINTLEIDWARVDAEVQKFLTPSQFAFFQSAEPPLPIGGRFQNQLYQKVEAAKKAEAQTKLAGPPGG